MICTDEILDGSLCNVEITNLDGTFCDVSALHDGDEILVNYYNRIGYVFDYWKDENGNVLNLEEVESDEEGKHSFKAEARCGGSFIAVFTPWKCAIKTLTNINGAGTQDGGGYYDYGNEATLKATVNEGYYFEGWYYNGYLVSTSYEFTLDVVDSADYTAYYSARNYIVSATPNDSSLGSTTGSGEYEYLSSCTITATAVVGAYFDSWSDGNTNPTRTFTVTSDVTVRAIFKAYSYIITVNKNVDACYADGSGQYAFNSIASLTARPANGYVFDHWESLESSNVSTDYHYTPTVTRNMTYTAIFRAVGYTLNVFTEPFEGGVVNGVSPYIVEVSPDTQVTLQPTPTVGFTYSGWSDNAQNLPADGTRTVVVQRDTTLTCLFAAPRYTLTIYVTPEGYGTVNGYNVFTQECSYGEVVTVTVNGLNYYTLDHWSDGSTETTRDITVTSDTTLTVTMQPTFATVELLGGGSDECLINGHKDYYNNAFPIYTPVPIVLTIPEGWFFDSIAPHQNIVSFTLVSGTTYNLIVSGDVTTKVYFGNIYRTVEAVVTPKGGGTVNGVADYIGTIRLSESVTLSAVAANGYMFTQWSDGNTNATRTVVVNENVYLVAEFAQVTYAHVELYADGPEGCLVEGVTTYINNNFPIYTPVPIALTIPNGCYFARIQEEATIESFTNISGTTTYNLVVSGDVLAKVYFGENAVSLKLVSQRGDTNINNMGPVYEANVAPNTDVPLTIDNEIGYYVLGLIGDSCTHVINDFTYTYATHYTINVDGEATLQGDYNGAMAHVEIGIMNPVVVTVEIEGPSVTAGYVQSQYDGNKNHGETFTFPQDSPKVLTAVANSGYVFQKWGVQVNGSGIVEYTTNPKTFAFTSNTRLIAYFDTAQTVTLDLHQIRNITTINGVSGTYHANVIPNTDVPLTIETLQGYEVTGMCQPNVGLVSFNHISGNSYTINIDRNYENELCATITDPVNITLIVRSDNPNTDGYVYNEGGGVAYNGQQLLAPRNVAWAYTAVPDDGYEFNSWNGQGGTNPQSFTFSSDSTLTVSFDRVN